MWSSLKWRGNQWDKREDTSADRTRETRDSRASISDRVFAHHNRPTASSLRPKYPLRAARASRVTRHALSFHEPFISD